MEKPLRVINISILLIMLLAIQSIFVFAAPTIEKTNKSPGRIEVETFGDGSLKEMRYVISATGATSGIRYRGTAMTIEIGNLYITIPTRNVTETIPPAGVQEFYEITISSEDIVERYKRQVGGRGLTESEVEMFNKGFANPKNINLGAHIEIYNAGTGKVLEKITSIDEIQPKASKYGFPKRNLDDMKSRFTGQVGQNTNIGDPPSYEDPPPKSGLRPSVIVR